MFRLRVLLFLAAAPAFAQTAQVRLPDLVAEAKRVNPEILAGQKRYEAAAKIPSAASSLPDPVVGLGYASAGTPRPFAGIGVEPMANAGVMVSQAFPAPGKRALRGEIASRDAQAAFEDYRQAELGVISRLKQAYYRLQNTYAVAGILESNRDVLRRFLEIARARYAVGRTAQQDLFKAQTELAILDTRLERIAQDRRSAEAAINTILNRPPDAPLGTPEETPPQPLRLTLDEFLAQLTLRAPALARQQKMVERSDLAVKLARKDYYPDFTVSGGYFYQGSMPDIFQARVDFTIPAYFWRKQRAAVAAEAAAASAARHDYQAESQTLGFQAKDDYLMAETSYRLMDMYSNTVIPESKLALESSLTSYQAGLVDFLNVFTNFSTSLEYQVNYREEVLNYLLATARLEELAGIEVTK
jgi:cobalt-zinc-cadmium efflux system outer membrane protein